MNSLYEHPVRLLDGTPGDLRHYAGQVLLIVNTASACGFTPQYRELEALYRQYGDQGLSVLAFPCNQFGKQEPGTSEEIGAFCERNYGVSFPVMEKIDVNGPHSHPLFEQLKREAPGLLGTQRIKWNFTKFLVKRDGTVFRRYAPNTSPASLTGDIERLLAER